MTLIIANYVTWLKFFSQNIYHYNLMKCTYVHVRYSANGWSWLWRVYLWRRWRLPFIVMHGCVTRIFNLDDNDIESTWTRPIAAETRALCWCCSDTRATTVSMRYPSWSPAVATSRGKQRGSWPQFGIGPTFGSPLFWASLIDKKSRWRHQRA